MAPIIDMSELLWLVLTSFSIFLKKPAHTTDALENSLLLSFCWEFPEKLFQPISTTSIPQTSVIIDYYQRSLHAIQGLHQPSGGFPYQQNEDVRPDSTAWAIIALSVFGRNEEACEEGRNYLQTQQDIELIPEIPAHQGIRLG